MRRRAKKTSRTPSDLDRTAAYRFGQPKPGQAADLGRPGRRLPLWPVSLFFFFSKSIFPFSANDCKIQNLVENVLCIQKL
jgi:hypothetical protein